MSLYIKNKIKIKALKSIGLHINDFPLEMSFTLDSFNKTLKKLKDEDL